ncbi:uncharacterized protein YdaL [Herbihabitans rhizosphaerae]|uniref:Uncharacterized protein YdaL n=1 Tax=Herbihabitans rhizosphaerae TaxID=1872711 RepID=A0A4Q7KGM1_9PSEU|nr:polysaccharide deacetylase family protein [Herbihabitans rhizosphaerae]RZS34011.1 uncharacterized protein YdaL [Herbihabitans rhizosphaerae]
MRRWGKLIAAAAITATLIMPAAPAYAAAVPLNAGAPGSDPARKTLVLYDTTGEWGFLGETYAVQIGQLASHGGPWAMRPVGTYTAGEMRGYASVIYVGSTYDEPLPAAFLDDTLAGSTPVTWLHSNIWQLETRAGNFAAQYGFDPGEFDHSAVTTIRYRDTDLRRDPLAAPSGIVSAAVTDPARATVVGTAVRQNGTTFPWGVRSGGLTYLGEVPLSYIGDSDRYFAFADVISKQVRPSGPDRKRALVRIEDVGPDADPAELRAIADYLYSRRVPFSIALYSRYADPQGTYNGGKPLYRNLSQAPQVVSAVRYMIARGGTILMHGYTHQFGDLDNPYNGVSGDDFEFYRAHVDEQDYVRLDGPVPGDSANWARGRISSARTAIALAGLPRPTIFEPPHYAASAVDYKVINSEFGLRYDRGLYFPGWCAGGTCGSGTPDYTRAYGQAFPYLVRDSYGSTVIPEGLGNIETEWQNHHPPRLPEQLLASARASRVVTDGVASFFYHPYLGVDMLRQVVEGVQGLGYTFTTPATVAAG